MHFAALAIALLLHQADEAAATPLDQSAASLEAMRAQLRALEHGMQEAKDLGDARAAECVRTGHLAVAHQVESAEEWDALLKDAVANGDAELAERLLQRITAAQREVARRASELGTCRLSLEPPAPVVNRTWFRCDDQPPSADNPAWRSCERRRGSVLTFGLEGLLVVAPVLALGIAAARGGLVPDDFGGLGLESAVGGLIGGVVMLAVSGGIVLALRDTIGAENMSRAGAAIGICTALGVGTGAITAMWLDRPSSGRAAPVAAAVGYLVIGGISALIIALHNHYSVTHGGDEDEPGLAEKSFSIAPALMAVSAMIAVPAAWQAFATR